jgi:hypothetical protein
MIRDEWETKISKENKMWINSRLLQDPSEINIKLGNSFTPLIKAVQQELSLEFIKFLLDKGANVNDETIFNDTAFCWAIVNNEIEIAKLLVEYGADIKHQTTEGNVFRFDLPFKTFSYLLSIGVPLDGVNYKLQCYKSTIFNYSDVVEEYLYLQSPEFIRWFKSERMEKLFKINSSKR